MGFYTLCLQQIGIWFAVVPYFVYFLSLPSLIFGILCGLFEVHMWEATHHRGFTHKAFEFRNKLSMFLLKNLHTSFYPDELFHFSHLSHHKYSDKPGDPYNAKGGLVYLYLLSFLIMFS